MSPRQLPPDPLCTSTRRHRTLRAHREDKCICMGQAWVKWLEYKERRRNTASTAQRRAERLKAATGIKNAQPAAGTARYPDIKPPTPSQIALWERDDRACLGTPLDWYYPTGTASQEQLERVRAICAGCPCLQLCMRAALDSGDDDAILAGTTPKQRRDLRSQRVEEVAA